MPAPLGTTNRVICFLDVSSSFSEKRRYRREQLRLNPSFPSILSANWKRDTSTGSIVMLVRMTVPGVAFRRGEVDY